jgi:hypothetical protein
MKRFSLDYLARWKDKPNRKPLVIRGARQVGKTELVRLFAKEFFDDLVEVNFDANPEKSSLFQSSDILETIRFLEIDLNVTIRPGSTLLFLDEIQAVPELLGKLRYFHEKMPSLHVVCAGSLLDFALAEPTFSVPVGRLEFMHLGPMSFSEYLLAVDRQLLLGYLQDFKLGDTIPQAIHEQLQQGIREFMIVGGMPGVLKTYVNSGKDLALAAEEQQSIIQTYYLDFAIYQSRVDVRFLQRIFNRIPAQVGQVLKYVSLDRDAKALKVREYLELLQKARLITRVCHSDGYGLPLAAEADGSTFKLLYLDCGLLNAVMGLKLTDFIYEDYVLVNRGAVAEQFIGQHLLYQGLPNEEPGLFYWNRQKQGAGSEVDFLTSSGSQVLPVEVKAGRTGRLKSLQVFVNEKHTPLAVRFNSEPPSLHTVPTGIAGQAPRNFELLSLPLYMVDQLPRFLKSLS